MRLLLTSDTQAELSNLDLCEQSMDELFEAAEKYKPDAVIHAGDLKENYDPVNLAVVKFWVRMVRRFVDAGHRFIINLGNHDRLSQGEDAKNWLDVLRAAGAEIATKPKVKKVGDGLVAFLPYTSNAKKELKWAAQLRLETNKAKQPCALIFHTELSGAALNIAGAVGRGNTVKDIVGTQYDAAFGGHLHIHQEIDQSVYYIGSPFCQEWGDANQQKGHLGAEVKNGALILQHFYTDIPGWYDAEYLEEHGLWSLEKGAMVRSRIQVTSKKITQRMREEEERLRQKYPEAQLFVVPQVAKEDEAEITLSGATDRENVEKYVAATSLEAAGYSAKAAVAYLVQVLAAGGASRQETRIKFISLEAHNTLSFRELKIPYSGQGLVLVKGKNKDWPKQSNGSGKTNLLSMLPVALFGETLKGQKNDGWANERLDGTAVIGITFKDAKGRKIKVRRARPHSISIEVDGKDISNGLTGKRKNETQGTIEDLCGFDLHLLKNAVYIDQSIANGFVFGAQKGRLDLMNKILDLSRYETALKQAKQDLSTAEDARQASEYELSDLRDRAETLEADIAELEKDVQSNWDVQYKNSKKALKQLIDEKTAHASSKKRMEEKEQEADELAAEQKVLETKIYAVEKEATELCGVLNRGRKLAESKKCWECGTPVSVDYKSTFVAAQKKYDSLCSQLDDLRASRDKLDEKESKLREQINDWRADLKDYDTQIAQARALMQQAKDGAAAEAKRNKAQLTKIEEKKSKLRKTKNKIDDLVKETKRLSIDIELYEYACKTLNRGGMPLYLANSLVPILNKAAEEFSDVFTGSKIRVRFEVVDGEFDVQIINPAGSEKSEGQSVGESAMAGVVAAFALRTAAPETNLLVLDEPGSGLDEVGQKQFAYGLIKLREMWPKVTMLVTTHSTIVQSILEGEATTWTVIKEKGISRLVIP